MPKKFVRCPFLLVYLFISSIGPAVCWEWRIGYEPFLVKQFNSKETRVYSGGTQLSSTYSEESEGLVFHLVSLRLSQGLIQWPSNLCLSTEFGISANPYPVEKQWAVSAQASNFSGTIIIPYSTSGGYWARHSMGFAPDGIDRSLTEEASLMRIPVMLHLDKTSALDSLEFSGGISGGLEFMNFSMLRRAQGSNFTEEKISQSHIAKTLGVTAGMAYNLSSSSKVFFDFGFNGVAGLSNFPVRTNFNFVFNDGYRFDGLLYNAKLGVSWKI